MRRAATLFERIRHDGRCASHGGPLVIEATPPRRVDDDVVNLAIARLRARLATEGHTK